MQVQIRPRLCLGWTIIEPHNEALPSTNIPFISTSSTSATHGTSTLSYPQFSALESRSLHQFGVDPLNHSNSTETAPSKTKVLRRSKCTVHTPRRLIEEM